ncbi:polymorphic toxin-type HINT domain-containing protein [Streptomyces zhihengii]
MPEALISTTTHPFWVQSEGRWIEAGDLRPGMELRTPDGDAVKVTDTRYFDERQRTHDLTVTGIHAYYVLAGSTPLLVHNCDGAGDVPSPRRFTSDDPDVAELANAIEERYPGHVVDVNHTRDGVEIDIETRNAIIEVKEATGRV